MENKKSVQLTLDDLSRIRSGLYMMIDHYRDEYRQFEDAAGDNSNDYDSIIGMDSAMAEEDRVYSTLSKLNSISPKEHVTIIVD